mmetsp:Transcript_16142/g.16746  ORF Transcript_16142/g.16746 Transcript_16142/m.16746 type:complete len:326 (+) Transcript_16142:40-1017(+)
MVEQNPKKAIQGTCSDALTQKVNAIEKGYFIDPYQLEFISQQNKQKYLPIINKGVWSRVQAIRSQVEYLIKNNSNNKTQIINLGCGMDSLHFHLRNIFPGSHFSTLELDYSEITKQKIKFIQSSQLLSGFFSEKDIEVSSDKKNFLSSNYKLLDCDLSIKEKVLSCLKQAEFEKENLTVILAECFLCYLSTEDIQSLLKMFTAEYSNCVIIYYDLIHPSDEFGKVMIKNLRDYRGIILPSYLECPDEKAQIDRLVSCGFTQGNVCVDMLNYFNLLIDEELKKKINHLELMDEMEEWNLLQKHSCIGVGIKKESKEFGFLDGYKLK